MNTNTIVYEKRTPAKTFSKPIYLLLGIGFFGVGFYYFTTQVNLSRSEEYIPLGLLIFIGLYFLIAYLFKWPIPGSKMSYIKKEFLIHPETLDLEYYFESSSLPRKKEIICSLKDVSSLSYSVESEKINASSEKVSMDPVPMTAMSKTSTSGIKVERTKSSFIQKKYFLILLPSNTKVKFTVEVPYIEDFVKDLNKIIADFNTTKNPL